MHSCSREKINALDGALVAISSIPDDDDGGGLEVPLPNPLHLICRLAGARPLATKLQCDVYGAEQASVLCCADEIVLCTGCDARIHSANKLGRKHRRFSLQL
ncbi:Zinc finger protein CONSTANS-LIKE 7 [Platanthera zijinensis]|uniref:Zinc finger protein CONSTANS-LIKE 7 n=1 Tax=Platanthera zijinensis TaxID=2320716 RepID=A0AAP0BN92_9ASPA